MQPIEIIKVENNRLQIFWDDGFSASILIKDLRENCPCAKCQGEQVGFHKFETIKLTVFKPEMFEIKSIEPIGNYALQFIWKDGHDTGIYSFEYLRLLMERFART